jgi:hypothetical protein
VGIVRVAAVLDVLLQDRGRKAAGSAVRPGLGRRVMASARLASVATTSRPFDE